LFDPVQSLSFAGVLEEHTRSFPGKIALVYGETRYTYDEIRARVERLANGLEDLGVGPGDRILWLGQNSHRILEGILAASRIGAMFCPANWRQSSAELAFVIDDLDARVVFWQEEEVGEVARAARALAKPGEAAWLQHDITGPGSYEALIEAAPSAPRDRNVDPDEPVLIIYTAAFDGRPNGAMLSQTTALTQNLVISVTQKVSQETVFLAVGPLFHLGTLMHCLTVFHYGGTNVMVRRSDAGTIARAIHTERCNRTWLVSKTMDEIVALNANGQYDLKCLVSAAYAPAWDRMVTIEDVTSKVPGYGQTEVMGLATLPYYAPGGLGVFGRPSPLCQLRILDEEGHDVAPGETGEIVIRGPIVMNGYWRREELNLHRRRGGWHHTHDLGRREKDGTLTFVGPKTQMIKSGVENIYPAEVEACIRRHPAVADCAIIGIPDPRWIQSVKAIVALKPGAIAGEAEIIEHCRSLIASYKKPNSVAFQERIPRNPLGGIDYKTLDSVHGGGNYPGGATRTY
jgi:acyl-CoA synthetase (AMP-forming)/AMP-acid ligase II